MTNKQFLTAAFVASLSTTSLAFFLPDEFTVASAPVPQEAPVAFDGVKLAKLTLPAAVVITTHQIGEEGLVTPSGTASGFAISANGYIVTNSHAVTTTGLNKVWLWSPTGIYKVHDAEIFVNDPVADIAILKIETPTPNFLALAPVGSFPQQGEQVAVMSAPHGLAGTFSTGIISAIRTNSPKPQTIQTTTPVSPGSSGSPMVNSRGEVVGIITSILTMKYSQSVNMGTSVNELHRLIGEKPL